MWLPKAKLPACLSIWMIELIHLTFSHLYLVWSVRTKCNLAATRCCCPPASSCRLSAIRRLPTLTAVAPALLLLLMTCLFWHQSSLAHCQPLQPSFETDKEKAKPQHTVADISTFGNFLLIWPARLFCGGFDNILTPIILLFRTPPPHPIEKCVETHNTDNRHKGIIKARFVLRIFVLL